VNYRNAEKNREGLINCEIQHPTYGWIPFQASPNDTQAHGRALYQRMDNDPDLHHETDEEYAERKSLLVRVIRDNRLKAEVDPIVSNAIRFSELSIEKQQEWKDYRTALLNVPQQDGFPLEIEWPTKPE
jgi:hypothetical protein